MLKLVILVCAIGRPCEYHWWGEPFRTEAGCYVAGYVAADDWLRAHAGYVLRGRSCEPVRTDMAAHEMNRAQIRRSRLINR